MPLPIVEEDEEEEQSIWTPLTIGLAVLALVLAAGAVYYFFFRKGGKKNARKNMNAKSGNNTNVNMNAFFNSLQNKK